MSRSIKKYVSVFIIMVLAFGVMPYSETNVSASSVDSTLVYTSSGAVVKSDIKDGIEKVEQVSVVSGSAIKKR